MKLQQHTNCTRACISMVSGYSIEQLDDLSPFTPEYPLRIKDEMLIYHIIDLDYIPCTPDKLYQGRVYVLTAPSLHKGELHRIVVDCRYHNTRIYDPFEGIMENFYSDIKELVVFWDVIEFPELSCFTLLN
jgi:hypothetical protein